MSDQAPFGGPEGVVDLTQRCDEAHQQLGNLLGTLRWVDGDVEPQQVIPQLDRTIRVLRAARRDAIDALGIQEPADVDAEVDG